MWSFTYSFKIFLKFSSNSKYAVSVIYNYITAKMWNVTHYFNTLGWILLSIISRVIPYIRFMLVERISKLGFYLGLKRRISCFKTCMQSNQGPHSLDRLAFVRVILICTAPCQTLIFIKLLGIRKNGEEYTSFSTDEISFFLPLIKLNQTKS